MDLLYLYVILDIFSRYGWMVAERESRLSPSGSSPRPHKQAILPGMLTIHADRGSSMISKSVALLLSDLGILRSHSRRPHVSNDNPYSESQFKTLKYRPDCPKRFSSIQDARAFGRGFFAWYNETHRHSSIGLLTPSDVHHGRTAAIHALSAEVLAEALRRPPGPLRPHAAGTAKLPTAAWINPPIAATAAQ